MGGCYIGFLFAAIVPCLALIQIAFI